MRERAPLFEVAGTFGFFNTKTEKELKTKGLEDHSDYISAHPEIFGDTTDKTPEEAVDHAVQQGWVRINNYRGSWWFHANSLRDAKKAVAYYWWVYDGLYEINVDIGPMNDPSESFSMSDPNEIQRWLKKRT